MHIEANTYTSVGFASIHDAARADLSVRLRRPPQQAPISYYSRV